MSSDDCYEGTDIPRFKSMRVPGRSQLDNMLDWELEESLQTAEWLIAAIEVEYNKRAQRASVRTRITPQNAMIFQAALDATAHKQGA